MQALILAGGMGTRLGNFVKDDPKPLLNVNGRPFVLNIVERLISQGITEIIFCLGYKAKKIIEYFGDGSELKIKISYVLEDNLKGTAGAIRGALKNIDNNEIIVLNGDSFCFFDLEGLMNFHYSKKAIATLTAIKIDNPDRYGLIDFNKNGKIKNFKEKEKGKVGNKPSFINAGVYILNKEIISEINYDANTSLEQDVLPCYIDNNLYVFLLDNNRFIDIGTPKSLCHAGKFFSK
jgi:NDP-sugar pyrophosphorylase family protein